jgi:hypothetical protein
MRATPLPPGALLPRAQWRALGVSTRRLAGPDLFTVFRGFSTPTDAPATVNTMCEVLQQHVVPGAIISHTTAAALLGIALPWWVDRGIGTLASAAYASGGRRHIPSTLPADSDDPAGGGRTDQLPEAWRRRVESGLPLLRSGSRFGRPEVQRPLSEPPLLHCRIGPGGQRAAGPHAKVHRTSPRAHFTVDGLELSHPYVVLLELAGMLEHDDIVIAVDSLISRDPPMRGASLEKISDMADSFGAAWGAPALREALRDARANTDSPGETRTRLLLRRAGFPEPAINHPVLDPDTKRRRYLDLAYPDLGIAVEYDGDHHRRTTKQRREDQARLDSLASLGWNIRTLNAEDIKRPARILGALSRTFLAADASAPPTSNWSGDAELTLGRSLRAPTTRQ